MSVGNKSLQHSFTVDAVQTTVNTDIFINVTKRKEEVLYRTAIPIQAANIAYVTSQAISSDDNLSISDRSTSLAANRDRESDIRTVIDVDTFTIDTDNLVLTNEFTEATQTTEVLPLFYKHVLSTINVTRDAEGEDLATNITLLTIEFLDVLGSPTSVPEIKIDYDKGVVYNNLKSEYSSSSNYTLYFIKYVIKDSDDEVKTFVDLLDNTTVYRIATYEDLNDDLELIDDGRKVYLIEEVLEEYNVVLPARDTYAYRPTLSAGVQILPSISSETSDPWYVRVTNGRFYTTISSSLYKYHIAEFLGQSFTPEAPLKVVYNETSTIINDSLIKFDQESIYEDTDLALWVDILINDKDGNGIAAFTTDSNNEGEVASNEQTYQKWSYSDRNGIKSIDHITGVVQIEGTELKSSYQTLSSYHHKETNYVFSLINFNPVGNPEALSTRVVLFIIPDTTTSSRTQNLYYLKLDDVGKVIESNWSSFDNDTQTISADGELLYYESISEFLQTTSPALPTYVSPDTHIFTTEYSTEGGTGGIYLILGDIVTSEAFGPKELTVLDTRQRGGGVIDGSEEILFDKYPEVEWMWDIGHWDGIPYPGNATYMVEVPVTIMDGAGGNFKASDVTDIILKHTAAGIYPLIRAYGIEVDYTDIGVMSGINLSWNGYGGDEYTDINTDNSMGHQFNVSAIV